MKTRARFKIVKRDSDVIAIVDLDEGMSVTNDAENVVRAVDPGIRQVIYQDTMGNWDEIEHDEGRFTGFRHLGVKTLEEALKVL